MGIESFKTDTKDGTRSPHSDLADSHIVNFMLSIEVEPTTAEESIESAISAVRELEEKARELDCYMEVVGPYEVTDSKHETLAIIKDKDIGVIWAYDPAR